MSWWADRRIGDVRSEEEFDPEFLHERDATHRPPISRASCWGCRTSTGRRAGHRVRRRSTRAPRRASSRRMRDPRDPTPTTPTRGASSPAGSKRSGPPCSHTQSEMKRSLSWMVVGSPSTVPRLQAASQSAGHTRLVNSGSGEVSAKRCAGARPSFRGTQDRSTRGSGCAEGSRSGARARRRCPLGRTARRTSCSGSPERGDAHHRVRRTGGQSRERAPRQVVDDGHLDRWSGMLRVYPWRTSLFFSVVF